MMIIKQKMRLQSKNQNNKLKKQMQKQPPKFIHLKSKSKSQAKSSAKAIIKQSINKLYNYYSSTLPSPISNNAYPYQYSYHELYLQIIDLTQRICSCLDACGKNMKDVVNISQIITNNFVLGIKTNYVKMAGGFVYVTQRMLSEGEKAVLPTLTVIRNIALQVFTSNTNHAKQTPIQLILALQNVKWLILPTLNCSIFSSELLCVKEQIMIQNALTCLIKIAEQTKQLQTNFQTKTFTNLTSISSMDIQQHFYHVGLKSAKISKLSKRNSIYKQLLASYFRYLTQHRLTPTLDICKLLIDALTITNFESAENSTSESKAFVSNSKNSQSKLILRDQQITCFLIRKCFGLLNQYYGKQNFYIQEDVLKQTIQICCNTQPYCLQKKTIFSIIQALFYMKKLDLFASPDFWMNNSLIRNIYENSNQKQILKIIQNQASNKFFITIFKHVISCFLYIQHVKSQFQHNPSLNASNDLASFAQYLQRNISILLEQTDPTILHIWYQIINNLHIIKSQVFAKCVRRLALEHRKWILNWSTAVIIQDIIISNPKFVLASGNTFALYQQANLYILIIREFLMPHTNSNTHKKIPFGQSEHNMNEKHVNLVKRLDQNWAIGMNKHWNDLISFGAHMLEQSGDSQSLKNVQNLLKLLLSCPKMIISSHNINPITKTYDQQIKQQKLNGIFNLFINLQKLMQQKQKNKENLLTNSLHLINNKIIQQPIAKTCSLKQLKKQKQKTRIQLLVWICKQFVNIVIDVIIPILYIKQQQQQIYLFQQVFAYILALIPQVQAGMNLQQRVFVNKVRTKIVQITKPQTLAKFRYTYHKTVALLLQDYSLKTYQKSTSSLQSSKDPNIFTLKSTIKFCLQSYHLIYPKQTQHNHFTQQSDEHQQKQRVSTQLKITNKINRRSSIKYIFQHISKNQAYHNIESQKIKQKEKEKDTSKYKQYMKQNQIQYYRILYLDFIQWVVMFCDRKNCQDLKTHALEVLDYWLNSTSLQNYLIKTIQACKQNNEQTNSIDIQLLLQCAIKLIYLQSQPPNSPTTKKPLDQQQTTSSLTSTIKPNIQFQFQQCSIRNQHINQIILIFAKICQQLYIKNMKNQQNNKQKQVVKIKNYNRLSICFNNIMSICYRLGYQYDNYNALAILCKYRLMLSQQYQTKLQAYTRYAQMLYLQYLPYQPNKIQQIQQYIAKHKPNNTQQQNTTYQNNIISLIKLYLHKYKLNTELQLPSITNQHYILKLLYTIQQIQHMHPHKSLLRSISGYIFYSRNLSESNILLYNQSLLPYTTPTINSYTNSYHNHNNGQYKFKLFVEQSTNQLQHHVLQTILLRINNCLCLHNQLSQLRSVLRLSLIYFIKSGHIRAILQSLYCQQLRTKHIPTNPNPTTIQHRKSQVISIGTTSQHNIQQYAQLDMLSISDTCAKILTTIYPTQFINKSYDKYCRLIMGNGNRRRTSMSFHISYQHIINILYQSIHKCGQLGSKIFLILSQHTNKLFSSHNQLSLYLKYLQINNKYLTNIKLLQIQKVQCNKLTDINIKNKLDLQLLQFVAQISDNKLIDRRQLQIRIIQKIREIIRFSYQHAWLLENLLVDLIRNNNDDNEDANKKMIQLSNQKILQLAILMLDHNYKYKSMVQTVQPIYVSNIDHNTRQLINNINITNKNYQNFLHFYPITHRHKIDYLLSSSVPHPLTILYPLGSTLLTISLCHPLTILQTDRSQFQQHIHTIDILISNNSKLLNDKNVDPKQWWKSRDRVDRSIGKIVNQIGLWGWDTKINKLLFQNVQHQQQMLVIKMVYVCLQYFMDVKKIKVHIQNCGIELKNICLDDIIIKVHSFINSNQQILKYKQKQYENLLLLTHPHYTLFPFQANNYLNKCRSVYRIPSFQYFYNKISQKSYTVSLNISKINYLINSGNDLPDTQRNFYKIKEYFPMWKGIIGRKPTIKQFFNLFQTQVFLYMGHGAGSAHLRQKQFHGHLIECLMMLFGCSSVGITAGKCEANGPAHSHLINGSPGVLGCLWEVTDKDTDRVTQNIFKSLSSSHQNLSRILQNSKKKCKHQYLNGGALVIFGIPTYINKD